MGGIANPPAVSKTTSRFSAVFYDSADVFGGMTVPRSIHWVEM
jgi:hypothetical protein